MLPARRPLAPAAQHRRRWGRPAPVQAAAAREPTPPRTQQRPSPRPRPCPPSPPSLHSARDALAERLLEALAASEDEDDDVALIARVRELVLEAGALLRASRDWPLLPEAALRAGGGGEGGECGGGGVGGGALFVAAGLGSLGGYRARLRTDAGAASPSARRRACPRAGMRLFQLALARLLLLEQKAGGGGGEGSGDSVSPKFLASCACDPEYDDALDLPLLKSLGFSAAVRGTVGEGLRAAAAEAGLSPSSPSPSSSSSSSSLPSPSSPAPCLLAYMPLCPREAYDEVLDCYWSADALPRLAVLGTSFGSQGETAALVAALSAFGGGGPRGGGGGFPTAEAPEPPSEKQSLLAGSDVLIETPAPDFACHGVGIALHTFAGGAAAAGEERGAAAAFFDSLSV
jgi:hypothetical protein